VCLHALVKRIIRRPLALLLACSVAIGVAATGVMPALASANYSPSILSDTPFSYWRLGEATGATTAADVKGRNALTYTASGVTLGQPGAILGDSNTAATFNGSTGDATAAVAGTTATTNWSVEAWVNPSNLNQAGTMVYNGISAANGYGFGISSATSLTTAGSELTGIVNGAIADSGYGFPSPNTWYHVVMTRDTTTIRWYVNGFPTSKTSTTAPGAVGARFSLGAGINSSSQIVRPYAGGIDEAAVYTVQLSAGRIAAHFQDGAVAISGIGQWTSLSPATVPTGRYDAASAFDASATDATHGKLVVFGGENSASAALQETWTWDGTNWTKLTPATSPSARWGARMAYDTATGLTYLFGGYTGSGQGYLNDTWKWDGTTWTKLSPTTSPTVRLDVAMAYDAATSTVVLFGGSKSTTYNAETWSWNGTNWTSLTPSPAPGLRANAGIAYDAAHSKIVMFGGYTGSAYLADTWLWNGTAWSSQTPGAAPSARTSAAMAYNPITSTTMLFGGLNGTSYYADSWSWDGSNWGLESSTSNPGARAAAVLAWDATTGNLVLFDGRNSTAPLTDTWNRNTPPGVATGVSGVAGNTQVTVSWTAASSGGSAITQYVVTASPGGATKTVTASPATVTGLTAGTAYTFTVIATNAIGTGVSSAASAAVTPYTTPGAPTGVTATAGNALANVSWTAPASNGGLAISSYTITSAPGGLTSTVSAPATSGPVTGLTNGTPYTFTVYATNAPLNNGPASSPSNSVTPSTIPVAPTNVVATAGDTLASLTWTAPANNGATITSYTATASPGGATATVNGNPAAPSVSYIAGQLTDGTAYTFTVVGHNVNGDGPASGPSNSVTPSVLPGAPTSVVATASNQQATVTWTAPAANGGTAISGYAITPCTGTPCTGGSAGSPVSVGAGTTNVTITQFNGTTPITNGTTYTFQVTATNTGGTGPVGVSNAVTPSITPQAPTNLGTNPGNHQVTVTWTAPDPGGSPITGYVITPNTGGTDGTPVNAAAGATSVIVTQFTTGNALVNGTAYTFKVYATNSSGNGFIATVVGTPSGPPSVPTNVAAAPGSAQATVSWGAPTDNGGSVVTGYTITPLLNGNPGTPISVGGTATSATITNYNTTTPLANGTSYVFQVYASNSAGNGAPASSLAVTVGAPTAPGSLAPTAGANKVSLTWTASLPNASSITGYVATAYIGGASGMSVALGPTAVAATISGLKGGTAYTIQVVAINSYGTSSAAISSPFTPTGSATTYASTVLADGAIAYYRMSDTGTAAADSSGNGSSGSYTGTYTHGTTGLIGSDTADTATSFDGSSGYAIAPTQTALQGDHARTIELWFNATSSAQQILFDSGGTGTNGQSFTIATTRDGGVCGAPANSAGVYVALWNDDVYIPGLHLNDGGTHHLVVTLSGSLLSVYADGVLTSGYVYGNGSWSGLSTQPFALAVTPNTTGNPMWIGGGRVQISCPGAGTFAGIIDEVAIYPTALSAAQVTNHFQLAGDGAPGTPGNPGAVAGTNQSTVTWTASQTNGAPITSYLITAYASGITAQNAMSVGGGATSAVITGLPSGGLYNFQIQARNSFGASSVVTSSGYVTIGGTASTTYSSTVLGNGAIAYYRLGDTGNIAADSSGFANLAPVGSGVTQGAGGALPGDADTAFAFSRGYVQDQSIANLPTGTSPRTYEAWFKTTSTGEQVLLSYGQAVQGCRYTANGLAVTAGNQVNFITGYNADCYGSWSSLTFTAPYSVTNGAWHQLAATWDGATVVMYVDGLPVGAQAYSTSLGAVDGNGLALGNLYGNRFLMGSLDEVSIYPSALSSTQVLNHFQASGNSRPAAPSGVTAVGGANSATVSWNAVTGNPSPLTGYVVTAMQGAAAKNALSTSATSTSVTMTGLQGTIAYTFQVQAANNFGLGLAGTSAAVTPTGLSTYASTVQGDSPAYYYRLDDASAMVADSSGHGRLAYASGAYTQGATGALANDSDTAFSFSRGSIQDQSFISLPSGSSARTFEAWVNTTSTQDQVLLSYGQQANGCRYTANGLALTAGNQVNFITGWNADCYSSWSSLAFITPYTIANGAWHQLVATWDGTTVTAYLDGQPIGSQAYSTSQGSVDSNGLVLGSLYGGRFVVGGLDEVSIYPSALSSTQVLNHFLASGNSQPAAPSGITTLGGPNKVTVSWNSVSNTSPLTGYVVTAMQGSTAKNALSTSATSTSVTMTGLQGGISYTFQVQAANNFGLGLAGASASVTPSGSATTYASTVQGDSPVYYYRLDDASTMIGDSSGQRRLAYAGGAYTQGATGVLANDSDAATIFTSTGAVQFAQGTGLPGGTSARTYEAWVKTTSTQDQALFSYGQSAGGCGLPANGLLLTAGNQVNFITRWNTDCYGSVSSLAFAAPSIANGAWHQVAATWDGATVTMYLDGQPIGSQAYTTSQGSVDANGLVLGSLYGGRHLVGSLDEVSIYPSALSATQIFNHFKASGNGVPTAPTAVSATSGQNSAVVSWTPPAPTNGAITGYTVAAITDGTTQATTTTDGSAQSANVPALLGGQVYTFTVAAQNAIGTGPASAPSAALTITASGNGPSPIAAGFGQYLYIWNTSNSPYGPGTLAIQSENTIPALASWTVEGWLNLGNGMSTYGTSSSWGVLSSQGGGAVAGVVWDMYNNAKFVWPGGGSYSFSPCGSCGWLQFVIQYDGTNVTGYVGGNQVFQQASSGAQVPANQYAGYSDGDERRTIGLDEFRVSSVARYTGSSFQVPTSPFSGTFANTTLLWHFDEQGIRKMWNPTIAPSQQFPKTFNGEFPDASGNGHGVQFYSIGGGYGYASPSVYQIYALGAGQTAATLDAGGSPWVCPCTLNHTDWPVNSATGDFWHTFDDISIPGRGFGLDFTRSYSSAVALATATGQEGQLGYGWSGSYNAHLTINGSVVTVYAGNGSAVTFTQSGSVFSAQSGVLASLALSGSIYTLTQQDGTQLNFDSMGRLTAQVDRNGYSTIVAYGGSGSQISTVTEPSQGNASPRQLVFQYNASGFVQTITDTSGRAVSYGYDSNGNMNSATDLNGHIWTFAYDGQHELTAMKSPVCVATQGCLGIVNAYANGRVTSQTDAMGRITSFAYSGGTTTVTDPLGNTTVDEYQNNLLLSETKAVGTAAQATWSYVYDPMTLSLLQVIDPAGNATSTIRDAEARVLTGTNAKGSSSNYSYNSFSEVLTTTDPLGTTETNTYDSAGNLTQSSTPLTGTSQVRTSTYRYEDASHPSDLTSMTDADGKVWLYTYDQYGNRTGATDPLGDLTTLQYDLAGRVTSKVLPRGNVSGGTPATYTWTFTYDEAGNQLTSRDPLTLVAAVSQYDADGNLITVTDPNGHWTNYRFDLAEEVTYVTRFDGSIQQTVYDLDGNILKLIDGRNQATVNAYDQQNRKVSVTDPLNRVTRYSYNAAGSLTSITDGNGHQTTYAYDSGNEPTMVSYQLAQPTDLSVTYDKDGRKISMTDGTGTSSYQYDAFGRLTRSVNGAGAAVAYTYDLMGRITSIAYPGGVGSVTRTYYDDGALHTVSDWLGNTTSFSYDADSNLIGVTYPNGITEAVTVDAAGRTSSIADSQGSSQILSFTYSRDLAGQLTGDGANTYSYDTNNRLTGGTVANYQYDSASRLTQMTPAGGNLTTLAYDNADQLTSATTTAGGTQVAKMTFAFDANGNRVSQTDQNGHQTLFGWDQGNDLISYGTNTYTYDGTGLRASKTVAGGTEAFTWDMAEGLQLLIQDGSTNYVTGPGGLPLEQINGTSVNFYHEDQLGSVRGITNSSGNLVSTYTYDPYGNIIATTGLLNNPFTYSGQYQDLESGLFYLRGRLYDPATCQFLSTDPMVGLTRQPYGYVNGNPLNSTDASGLWPDLHLQAGWNALSSGAKQIGGQLEQSFHENAAAIAGVAHGAAMVCGAVALVLLVAVVTGPAAAIAGGCVLAASLVAAVADADLAAHGDKGHGWGDVAWDALGAVPDLGAAGSAAREAYYTAKLEKGLFCHGAVVASRNAAEFYNQAQGFAMIAGAGNELREIDHLLHHS
jgi:RHS repeat-associated protein